MLGSGALGVYAALNIHTTLQYIGVLGVLLTVVNKALSYDSPQEALDDAKGAVSSAQKAFEKLGSIKAPTLPNLPKLPQGAAAMGGSNNSSRGSSAAAGAGAALSAAAVAGGSSGRAEADVGEETEQELVD